MRALVINALTYQGLHIVYKLIEQDHFATLYSDGSYDTRPAEQLALYTRKGYKTTRYTNSIDDEASLLDALTSDKIDVVIYCLARTNVRDSIHNPQEYYEKNVGDILKLLSAMKKAKVYNIVFCSSFAVYGDTPNSFASPLTEQSITNPISAFGNTVLAVENILKDWCAAVFKANAICLRFSTLGGAHPSGILNSTYGYDNLLSKISKAANNKKYAFYLYKSKTSNSCVRDYVHILDAADAVVKASSYVINAKDLIKWKAINICSHTSYSTLDVIDIFEKTNNRKITIYDGITIPGEISSCTGSNKRVYDLLNWKPKYTIEDMCKDAWQAEVRQDFRSRVKNALLDVANFL